ncbi:MAG: DUF1552 domain-containing protein [Candidatus Binatia bacterium]|nr:DUF1552 domain-containing protein [Candidatus Binatia bacterium]
MWHKRISRRTVLKAGGVALALPMLDVMRPLRASAAVETRRMVNIGLTLGLYTPSWLPATTGRDYEASEYLSILDDHRSRYTVLSGLSHEDQSGRQPHNSEITWLTGQRHPGQDGFRNTISIDQAVAIHLGYVTRFPSVTLGTVQAQSQSYTSTGVMVPAESDPARVFQQMFLQGTPEEVAREKARLRDGASILDHLRGKRATLRGNVSASDTHTLDAYFDAVRDAEFQLAEVQAWAERPKPMVSEESPLDAGGPAYLIGSVRSQLKMIPLILETDSSRVVSLMVQDHSVVPIDVLGVGGDQHGLSHHGQQPDKIDQLRLVETEIVLAFRDFLDEMQDRKLLDDTSVLFGSNLGNASSHEAKRLPILVVGGGFDHGEHKAYGSEDQDAPLSDLYVTLLRRMGVETDAFGQSQGALDLGAAASGPSRPNRPLAGGGFSSTTRPSPKTKLRRR